jgi:hypothetical protein
MDRNQLVQAAREAGIPDSAIGKLSDEELGAILELACQHGDADLFSEEHHKGNIPRPGKIGDPGANGNFTHGPAEVYDRPYYHNSDAPRAQGTGDVPPPPGDPAGRTTGQRAKVYSERGRRTFGRGMSPGRREKLLAGSEWGQSVLKHEAALRHGARRA